MATNVRLISEVLWYSVLRKIVSVHSDPVSCIAYNLLSLPDNLVTGSVTTHTKGGLHTLSSPSYQHETSINRPTTNDDKGSATQRQLTFHCLTCQVIEMERI